MKKTKYRGPTTNIEFLTDLMDYGHGQVNGAFFQMFIIDALTKWADTIIKTGLPALKEKFGERALVNPEAWYATAVELKKALEDFYNNRYKESFFGRRY